MTKKSNPPPEFTRQGILFKIRFALLGSRRHSESPYRAYINPLDSSTNKPFTKRQLLGKNSDQPVNYTVYGKDPWDIYDNQRETAADYLLTLMTQQGLLSIGPAKDAQKEEDLGALARDFEDMFFSLHESEWRPSTVLKYRGQYKILADLLSGFQVGALDSSLYRLIQEKICQDALSNSTSVDKENWKYGDTPPSSASTRMNLLYCLIDDLKQVEGIPIPVSPTRYNSKPSRQKQLVDRIDSARSLPKTTLLTTCAQTSFPLLCEVLADTGLRISELSGLLFDSVRSVETSQGLMYFVEVTGQLDRFGRRTEITKTKASYRVIPLSSELGVQLQQHRQELEQIHGDVTLRLITAQIKSGELTDDDSTANNWRSNAEKEISKLLQRPSALNALKSKRVYVFDEKVQDTELKFKSTPHSFRRNYCTGLRCNSGLDSPEIYRYMGHLDESQPKQSATGLTPNEQRLMCLRQHVRRTLFHEPNPLYYSVDGPIQATEVPACKVVLMLPAGADIELTVDDMEPGNVIHVEGAGLEIHHLRRDERRDVRYTYALLTNDEDTTIVSKRKLVG